MKTTLTVEVEYDPAMTDPESLACAMDRLLETALSTPDIFDDYGNPKVGEFLVWPGGYGHAWGIFFDNIRELGKTVYDTLAEAQAKCDTYNAPDIYPVEIIGCPTHEPDEAEEYTDDGE
jgi:hypothetical protein